MLKARNLAKKYVEESDVEEFELAALNNLFVEDTEMVFLDSNFVFPFAHMLETCFFKAFQLIPTLKKKFEDTPEELEQLLDDLKRHQTS